MRTTAHPGQNRIVRAIDRRIHKRFDDFVFWRAMRRFTRSVSAQNRSYDETVLPDLVQGWGNRWSAQHEYLAACLAQVWESDGPILECGSGLSTILIGVLAQASGKSLWSLEHDVKYAAKVRRYVMKYGLGSVNLCVAPLSNYGEFDWYTPPSLDALPERFSLVICDGPPETTRGGRFGLVPVMLEKLRPDCTIMLDDGAREGERAIAARWVEILGGKTEILGREKPFIRLKAGQYPLIA